MNSLAQQSTTQQQIARAITLFKQAKLKPAYQLIKKVLKKVPNHPEALHTAAAIEFKQGKTATAIQLLEKAILIKGDNAEWHKNLAVMYQNQGKPAAAVQAAFKATQLQPAYAEAHYLLGEALLAQRDYQNAVTSYANCLNHNKTDSHAYLGLAAAFNRQNMYVEAIHTLHEALKYDDNNPRIYSDLAANYFFCGQLQESIQCLKRTVELNPHSAANHSSLISTLLYRYDFGDELFADFLLFNLHHGLPYAKKIKPHVNTPIADRRLKLGYVSADFYNHAVSYYIEPVMAAHNRTNFEIYCYYNNTIKDDTTRAIQKHCQRWRECIHLNDDELAKTIRKDQIDILIDLSGHSLGNRLPVFAQKPAPIQVTWIGFPCTTGLTAMDYIFMNDGMVSEQAEQFFSEKVIRLQQNAPFIPPKTTIEVNQLPALTKGYMTFASFNAIYKVTDDIIALWCAVLHQVPHSKLLVFTGMKEHKDLDQYHLNRFSKHGIEPERIILYTKKPLTDYLRAHHDVDVCLDTYPYNGATTSRISLWMGVPVITLEGISPHSRISANLQRKAGIPEFIAASPEQYVNLAETISSNLPHLNHIRSILRANFTKQAVATQQQVTLQIERNFRNIWNSWCENNATRR